MSKFLGKRSRERTRARQEVVNAENAENEKSNVSMKGVPARLAASIFQREQLRLYVFPKWQKIRVIELNFSVRDLFDIETSIRSEENDVAKEDGQRNK